MMFAHEALTDVERGTEVTFTYTSNRSGNEITKTGVKTSDGHVDVDPENAEVYAIESSGRVEKSRKVGELVEIEVHDDTDDGTDADDVDAVAAVDETNEIEEGTELRDTDSQNVLVVSEKRAGGCKVREWSDDGRLQNTQNMSTDTLQDGIDAGELQRL